MYVNCFPLHFCCLQLVTKAMLLYNSAICDLLRESIQIMKILIHLKVVILVSEKWNEHNLMYIDHKQCEIMQKIQWNSSKANFTDFPLTDGAVVEPQCLCKWLQEIDSKRKSISVHCFCRVFAHFFGKFGALLPTTCMSGGYSKRKSELACFFEQYRALKQMSSAPQGLPPPTQL